MTAPNTLRQMFKNVRLIRLLLYYDRVATFGLLL
jgi:hypothetical protein